jgi:hypothetical protein
MDNFSALLNNTFLNNTLANSTSYVRLEESNWLAGLPVESRPRQAPCRTWGIGMRRRGNALCCPAWCHALHTLPRKLAILRGWFRRRLPQICEAAAAGSSVVDAFDHDALLALKVITVTGATASLFGSMFIMLTFHLTQTRHLMMHIVYALSFSDMATSIVYICSWGAISTSDVQTGARLANPKCWRAVRDMLLACACRRWPGRLVRDVALLVLGHRPAGVARRQACSLLPRSQ